MTIIKMVNAGVDINNYNQFEFCNYVFLPYHLFISIVTLSGKWVGDVIPRDRHEISLFISFDLT